jgi:hypothetical protein
MVGMRASRLILLAVVLLALAGSAMTALLLSADHDPELGETVHVRTVRTPGRGPTTDPAPSTTSATPDPSESATSTSSPPRPSRSTTSTPAPDRIRATTDRPQATRVTRTPPRAGVDDDDDHDDWDDADDDRDDGLDD